MGGDIFGDRVIVARQLGAAFLAVEQVAHARGQLGTLAGGALDRIGELGRVRGRQGDDRHLARQVGGAGGVKADRGVRIDQLGAVLPGPANRLAHVVGIGAAFLTHVVVKVVRGKIREIHPLLWAVAIAFAIYFLQYWIDGYLP